MNGYAAVCPACNELHTRYNVQLPSALLADLGVALMRQGGDPLQVLPAPVGLAERRRDPSRECRRGHEWTTENTSRDAHGWRHCRTCRREAEHRRRA